MCTLCKIGMIVVILAIITAIMALICLHIGGYDICGNFKDKKMEKVFDKILFPLMGIEFATLVIILIIQVITHS